VYLSVISAFEDKNTILSSSVSRVIGHLQTVMMMMMTVMMMMMMMMMLILK